MEDNLHAIEENADVEQEALTEETNKDVFNIVF